MYAVEAIRSLSRQSLDGFHILYVDDGSEDRTGELARYYLQELFAGRHDYVKNPTRLGKSQNIWTHLRPRAESFDFVAILDADDQLADTSILEQMATQYAAGKDVVWTNYFTDSGHKGQNRALDPKRSPRVQAWRTSHFFSFRASLLENIPESYYKDSNGGWYQGACDVALALPLLDQTRNYQYLPKLAYRYTMTNPLSLHNSTPQVNEVTSKLQLKNSQEIFAKPPLPLLRQDDQVQDTADLSRSGSRGEHAKQLWQEPVGQQLIARYPKLSKALSVAPSPDVLPQQLSSLSEIFDQRSGRILYIGKPETASLVVAMAREHAGCSVTCLMEAQHKSPQLRSYLRRMGAEQEAEIVSTTEAGVQIDGKQCLFPSCAVLKGAAPFSVIIVDARDANNEETYTVVALPAVSDHLCQSGFHFCALTSGTDIAERVKIQTSRLTVGLEQRVGGLGGTGIVTFPAGQDQQ